MIQSENKFLKKKEENATEPEIINDVQDEEKKVKWDRSKALMKAQKIYYHKNKEKLIADQIEYNKEYVKQSWVCDCQDTIKLSAKYLHMRSNRHKRRMMLIKDGKNPSLRKCDEKFICVCGSTFITRNKKTHDKCLKHREYIKETQSLKEEEAQQ